MSEEEEIGGLTVADEVVGAASESQSGERDGSLQERADKYNLSAINVRSIIHVRVHVRRPAE